LEKHEPNTGLDTVMTPDLKQFTQYARAKPNMEYNALMGLLIRQEGLLDSFQRLAGNKAPGVDGLKKVDYAIGLENRFRDLSFGVRLESLEKAVLERDD
jgi:hypothetical protein